MRDLAGKVAMITGGGSGIGRGIALALADEGARIVSADIELEPAGAAAADVRRKEVCSIAVRSDVAEAAAVAVLAARAFDEFGAIHIHRNSAGVSIGGPVETPLPPRAGSRPNVMDPLEVGRLVVEGIKENRPHIYTHLSVKPWIEERCTQILTDFEPVKAVTAAAP